MVHQDTNRPTLLNQLITMMYSMSTLMLFYLTTMMNHWQKVNSVAHDSDEDTSKSDHLEKTNTAAHLNSSQNSHGGRRPFEQDRKSPAYTNVSKQSWFVVTVTRLSCLFVYDEHAHILGCETKCSDELASASADVGPQSSSPKWTPIN